MILRFCSILFLSALIVSMVGCKRRDWPPDVVDPTSAPVLSPSEALKSLVVPPGFLVQLVAAEPLVEDPVAIDFDPEGRIYVVEMRGYMNDIDDRRALEPIGDVVVLEDIDGDGLMDKRTVFLDSLVLPNAVKVLSDGVLVSEPPMLWFARDLDGDFQADVKEVVSDRFGIRKANAESNANGLVWGLDNWIHTSNHDRRFRRLNGQWIDGSIVAVGQFGLTMDDFGRMYRNNNANPVFYDYVGLNYYARNPNQPTMRGVEEAIAADRSVWPIRNTRGSNRGYQAATLREDGTLARFTAACGPGVYRGDTYPAEFREKVNVFVAEPVGNLVHRFVVEERGDTVAAVHGYQGAAFLASTDERFRPVNTMTGPDGNLYVVDLYRGIVQHRDFVTTYLRKHIVEYNLEGPIGLGRIYRVVRKDKRSRSESPRLSSASAEELVEVLDHPNGWWRDTAQRLLVERGDTSVAPALRKKAHSEDERTRLHALWTLEGLGALEAETVRQALVDDSPHVRAAGIRMAEPWLQTGSLSMLGTILEMVDDSSAAVRLQLAASLGEALPGMVDSALADMIAKYADQKFLVETAVSGLYGRELTFLERLLKESENGSAACGRAVTLLTSAIVKAGKPSQIDRVLGEAAEAGTPQWQALALLEGVADRFPGGRGVILPLKLRRRPTKLDRVTQASDPIVRERAQQIAERLTWPGKPDSRRRVDQLLPEAKQRFDAGREIFAVRCAACHGEEGEGKKGLGAPLVGSKWVRGTHQNMIRILLHGKEGQFDLMPPQNLTDEELANVLTYVRNAWSNRAYPITPEQVADTRKETAAREMPWTDRELEVAVH